VGDCVDADYYSLGDCEVPDFNTGVDFETPMTICDFWGYNDLPGNKYRDVKELIHQLVDIVSLGGNYLLNVGPDERGVIPAEAQEKLRGVGEWMKTYGEAIYGTQASPFPAKPSWGKITAKGDALYLFIYNWNETLALTGLKNKVKSITLLADPGREITWTQKPCGSMGYDRLAINLPGNAPDPCVSVVKVQFEASLQTETRIIEDDSGSIQFPACLAAIRTAAGQPRALVNITGVVKNWLSTEDWFEWEFLCEHPKDFEVSVTITTGYHGVWDFGHKAIVECDGEKIPFTVEDSGVPTDHFQKRVILAGRIRIGSEGLHCLSIKALKLSCAKGQGFQLSAVQLQPLLQ
jgi:alpha-L-fucosidase